jgi:hypothetical protein
MLPCGALFGGDRNRIAWLQAFLGGLDPESEFLPLGESFVGHGWTG